MPSRPTNIEAILEFLAPVVERVGEYEVFVQLSRSLPGFKLARFRVGSPLVAIELDEEDVKMHVADRSSVRRGEPALTVNEFVAALNGLPESAADRAIYYATSIRVDEYTMTMNIPVRSLSIFFKSQSKRMLVVLREREASRG